MMIPTSYALCFNNPYGFKWDCDADTATEWTEKGTHWLRPPATKALKQIKLDIHYLRMALLTGLDLSKDPSTKVGALIVSENRVSGGYNGYPRGTDDSSMSDKEEKHARVIHAELNALLNCPFEKRFATLYCSMPPCHKCLGHAINAGISRVVWYVTDREMSYSRQDIFNEWLENLSWAEYSNDSVFEMMRESI
jgi:deoxycytidylate deaminase